MLQYDERTDTVSIETNDGENYEVTIMSIEFDNCGEPVFEEQPSIFMNKQAD